MMDPASEVLLVAVNPILASRTRMLNAAFVQAYPSDSLIVVQGVRSWTKQADEYAQGRTTPGAIVTDAPPGYSWHQFGMAVDVCPRSLIRTSNWSPESPLWPWLAAKALQIGLYPGECFHHPDLPHFQYTAGVFPVTPDDEMRQLFHDGGMEAVWEELDKRIANGSVSTT